MKLKIGIGFVTGRKLFQNVLKTYINNWIEHNLLMDEDIEFHLFIAYDLKYKNTKFSDYKKIPPILSSHISSINFYGVDETKNEIHSIIENETLTSKETHLIFGDGYGKKRNILTYFAIKHQMDKLMFIDDDEYPLAVIQNKQNKLFWAGQGILSTHLKFNDNTAITHGHHCGYISPIPYINFNHQLTEYDFKKFIQAISNDIINWEKIRDIIINQKGVTYADEDILNKEIAFEVIEENGMKFISGANLCFNLKNLKKFPPFYNPPGARGEDAFMSTALTDISVLKVPCYAFHDGFSMYNNILHGVLPTNLLPIEADSTVVLKRFINAAIGWIRYKPLLVYITNQQNFESIMNEMLINLEDSIPKINEYFNTTEFNKIFTEFTHYRKNVKKHFNEFEQAKQAWEKLLTSIR